MKIKSLLIGCLLIINISCSIKTASIRPASHYVYPNSNVTPLGETSAKIVRFGFIFPPAFKPKHIDRLNNAALSKYSGADLILDVKTDTRIVMLPFMFLPIFNFMKVQVKGTAAKMEVGKQDIGQTK